ncbi:MAG: 16S rRNA (adenine(1518)-N(6)/adenine(1519)-N(6))-dimethyltransferase RsmA [Terriglobia bacterium]
MNILSHAPIAADSAGGPGGARLRYNRDVARARRPRLGQHFLSSENYRRRIVESLPLRSDDLVVEIGPGRGAMTELLAERARSVVAIELDSALAGQLKETLKAHETIEILQGDILSVDLAPLCRRNRTEKCFVFGNLPYYITSPILHHFFDQAGAIRAMSALVQREVADRLTAAPGSRDYGYLTVLTQLHAEPRMAFHVPPGAFSPPPKVQSALVHFVMRSKFPAWPAQDRRRFLDFVKLCFAQKRKTLANNLRVRHQGGQIDAVLRKLEIPPRARAEELALEEFAGLFARLTSA